MNILKPKLIVFDWDGTLADSVSKIIQCKKWLANKYKLIPPSNRIIKNVLGLPFEKALALCFPTATPAILRVLAQEFHILMQQDTYQADLFPHVKESLIMLKNNKVKLAIATSKARIEMDKAIAYNDLSGIFNIICCGHEYQSKPDPAMLHYIMKKFNVKANECLMIGDTTTDIIFSKNAGVNIICVTFGAHSTDKLKNMEPLAFMDNWAEFPQLLKHYDN